jgi:hypothetical protein
MTQPTLLPGQSSERTNGNQERYGFSGHQTFPFRYSWLKKAVDAVHEDPNVFRREDAVVIGLVGCGSPNGANFSSWKSVTRI